MIHYFKNNKIIMSSSDGLSPTDYDFTKENLTTDQLDLISQGYIFQKNPETGEDELVKPEGWDEEQEEKEREKKRQECEEVILIKYPYYKQLNIIRSGGKSLDEMGTWIDTVRGEFGKNGKDANFTQFLS